MTQGAGSLSGGNVSLQSQEVNLTAVNQRLVVAPPGYSKKTSGLLVRVINAFMDIIRNGCLRYRAGLFFDYWGTRSQILDQFNVVAQAGYRSRPEELKRLEWLLQGLSDRGVYYILGEFAKQISGSAPVGVVRAFDELCKKEYQSKGSSGSEVHQPGDASKDALIIKFIDESILDRLGKREKFKIYDGLRQHDFTFMRRAMGSYRDNFKSYTCLAENDAVSPLGFSEKGYAENLSFSLRNSLHSVEQAFYFFGHIAKHVLVDKEMNFLRNKEEADMKHDVDLFNKLFKAFYEKSSFINDGYSIQNCALWVLSQLEEGDREEAIRVLGEHGSPLL